MSQESSTTGLLSSAAEVWDFLKTEGEIQPDSYDADQDVQSGPGSETSAVARC